MLALACPRCAAAYEVPDRLAGKQVRCPQCRELFPASGPDAPPVLEPATWEDAYSDDRPRPRPRRTERPAPRRRLPRAARPRSLPRVGLVVTTVLVMVAIVVGTAGVLIARLLPTPPAVPAALVDFNAAAGNEPDPALAARPRPAALPVPRLSVVPAPEPVEALDAAPLIRARHAQPEAVGFVLDLPAGDLVPELAWSDDGASFYCLERAGRLRQVRTADLSLVRSLDLGRPCNGLACNPAFVFVALPEANEVSNFHADTLRQQNRRALRSPSRLVVPRTGNFALAVPNDDPHRLYFLGAVVGSEEKLAADFLQDDAAFDRAALSPDGRRLFALGAAGQLQRFAVPVPGLLLHEQDAPLPGKPDGPLLVSPDGTRLAVVARSDPPQLLLFAAADLAQKPHAIPSPPLRPLALGSKSVYGHAGTNLLVALDAASGQVQWRSTLATAAGETPLVMTLSPTADRLLVLTQQRLILFYLTGSEKRP